MRKSSCAILVLALSFLFSRPLYAIPKNLKGSIASQKRQNRIADRYNLTRLKDRSALKRFIKKGLLVEVVDTDAYYISVYTGYLDPGHEDLYRHTRPWVKLFLDDVLVEGHKKFGEDFKITSLVRTRWYQRRLIRKNRNAIGGRAWWQQSSHLTGSTVDISYKDMSPKLQKWFEKRLSRMERQGLIEANKEYGSRHYHIMVHPRYAKIKKRLRKKRKTKTRP